MYATICYIYFFWAFLMCIVRLHRTRLKLRESPFTSIIDRNSYYLRYLLPIVICLMFFGMTITIWGFKWQALIMTLISFPLFQITWYYAPPLLKTIVSSTDMRQPGFRGWLSLNKRIWTNYVMAETNLLLMFYSFKNMS